MPYPGLAEAVCVVTGGGQGIGEAVVRSLASHGARVAILDRCGDRAERVARELETTPHSIAAMQVDVSQRSQVEAAVEAIERSLGPIRVLVNAAGILRVQPSTDTQESVWDDLFSTNAKGVFLVSRAVTQRMIPRRRGCVVTVGSNAAGIPRMNMAAYCASKAAAGHFTKCLGLELAAYGIRCNVVCPGSIDTPMQRTLWQTGYGPEEVIAGSLPTYRVGIPLRKLGTADEVAHSVLFLASDHASHITMQDLYVDGGASLRA